MNEQEESLVLEIDPEIIRKTGLLLADAVLTNQISVEYGKMIIYEEEAVETIHVIRLDLMSSSVLGLTDPLGQAIGAISGALESAMRWVWDRIADAIADLAARIIRKIEDIIPALADKIAYAIEKISGAIAKGIADIGASISTGLANIGAGLTALSTGIVNLGTSISSAVNMVGTSISTQILNMSSTLSNAIVSLGSSIGASITTIGASLSQAILSVGASISQTINSISYSISQGLNMLATSLAGAINTLAGSISGAIAQISGALSVAVVQISGAISTGITMLASSLGGAILTLSTSISTSISMLGSSLSSAILQVGTSITTFIGELSATMIANFYLLTGKVDYAVAIMQNYLPAFRDAMVSTLKEMNKSITETMTNTINAIRESYIGVVSTIRTEMEEFSKSINQVMRETVGSILENMRKSIDTISQNMLTMADTIKESSKRISDALTEMYTQTSNAIRESYLQMSNAIRESMNKMMESIRDNFTKMSDALRDSYLKTRDSIFDTSKKLHDLIIDQSKGIVNTIVDNFKSALKEISDTMDEFSKRMMEMAKTFEGFVNSILQLPDRLDPTMQKHARYVWQSHWDELITRTTPDIVLPYQKIPEFFKEASPSPWEGFKLTFVKAYESLSRLPTAKAVVAIAPPAVLATPRVLPKQVYEWTTGTPIIFAALENVWASFLHLLSTAYEVYIKPVIETIGNAIWEGIKTLGEWLMKGLKGIGEWFTGILKEFGQFFTGSLTSLASQLSQMTTSTGTIPHSTPIAFIDINAVLQSFGLTGVASAVAPDLTYKPISFIEHFISLAKEYGKKNFDVVMKELGIGSPEFLTKENVYKTYDNMMLYTFSTMALPLLAQIPVRAIAYFIYQIGQAIYNSEWESIVSLDPFGIGLSFTVNWGRLIGGALTHFSKEMKEMVDVLSGGLVYGFAIWLTQPLTKFINFHMRNIIPIELPTLEQMLEFARRSMPHKDFKDVYETMKFYTALYGFSDFVIDLLYKPVEEYYIEIKDRFYEATRTTRKIPISLMYNLPSPSDVARMMVRDIILELESFEKFFLSRGMSKDIAVMYYLLHFRYPPPEKLWDFIMRGISGLLWFKPSDLEKKLAGEDAQRVGAWAPKDVYTLNFEGKTLFDAFASYMKWHDYAKFSYLPNFTSDNQIMIDTLADIPTKIDQRWMVRFGLYQLMAERGITLKDPVSAFITKLVEGQPQSKITLDLTNFCRTLQATGLHPYYIPITAVAETINTIVDERTLLRTGVLNLYKEGFINSTAVMKMFTGLLVTSFKVAYYDIDTHTWKEGFINVPLRYLEMEARLMGIRAIIDRSLDILRDIQKDVLTAYQEYIIPDYDKFKEGFTKVIDDINSIYVKEFREVTGTEIPDELKLRFVDEYYKPYVSALSIWREVYTVRRIRAWTMRWLGWLMYRVGYGVVKAEEVEKLVEFMASTCRMPELEKKYIDKVLKYMSELSMREYIPTPSQLATMAEYVVIPSDVLDKVFELRGIKPEYAEIWRRYIEVRPLADDVRALVSAYIRALRYSPEAIAYEKAVKGYMARIGYTDEELKIFNLRIELEELILQSREYVPTPSQLATLAEYTPVPDALINKAFEIRKIPEEWATVWRQFIDARTIADDVRNLVTTYLRALRYNPQVKAFEGDVKAFLQKAGFDATEVKIFELRAMIEELSYGARQYVPTPTTLATVCEIIPEARGYFSNMVQALGIPSEWQGLWAKYIDLRPLVDDLKKLVTRAENLYKYFIIPDETFMTIIQSYGTLMGYTDKEIEFLLYLSQLERHATAWREIIGDIDRLLTLSEISPKAREYALGMLYKMIDSLNIDDETKKDLKEIWEQYIRIKPVKDEVTKYITDLINAFVDGNISQQIFEQELDALKEWGLDDYEIQFYKAIATLRKARKLKITLY